MRVILYWRREAKQSNVPGINRIHGVFYRNMIIAIAQLRQSRNIYYHTVFTSYFSMYLSLVIRNKSSTIAWHINNLSKGSYGTMVNSNVVRSVFDI